MPRTSWLILLLLPAGCQVPNIPQPPGPWSGYPEPNDWNLHVMVANPQDLSNGQAAKTDLAIEAVPPVRRLFSGLRTALPNITADQTFSLGTAPTAGGVGAAGQQQQQ